MHAVTFLLLAIPLVEGFIKPIGNELMSRSTVKNNCTCPLSKSVLSICPGHCEDGWAYYSRKDACYKAYHMGNFDDAEGICEMKGGHLASIHSFAENEFVTELAKSGVAADNIWKGTWIGLRQAKHPLSKEWTWTDGTEVDYTPWSKNQPDDYGGAEHCAHLFCDAMVNTNYEYRKWNDAPCSLKMRTFVCKKEAMH
ncbi:unnamed protein product [Cylicocyclus nassatus]|uniref:C-type lectin domain-containing protein n=1 Tax=Cylicocyclus nassatus TaxID=53992 RepID=A0AA36M8I9_CYLNA|nr:unnamed protein product [Cylicocyclus nassatus]